MSGSIAQSVREIKGDPAPESSTPRCLGWADAALWHVECKHDLGAVYRAFDSTAVPAEAAAIPPGFAAHMVNEARVHRNVGVAKLRGPDPEMLHRFEQVVPVDISSRIVDVRCSVHGRVIDRQCRI